MSLLEDSSHPTTEADGQRWMEGFSRRGVSQGSSLSLPSAQKRLVMASRSGAGRLRNQPGVSAVHSISSSVKLQSDVSETRGAWGGGTGDLPWPPLHIGGPPLENLIAAPDICRA